MFYVMTGATGFLGRYIAENLLQDPAVTIYAIVRKNSLSKLEALQRTLGVDAGRLVPVFGELSEAGLGLSAKDIKTLTALKSAEFFHVAALYDLTQGKAAHEVANVQGTQHALALAKKLGVARFHHISSIAVAGLYKGTFKETMLEEAGPMPHPYLQTKHDAEKLVRAQSDIPYRIYRPSMVVGHSQTGHIDKVDGPYYAFKFIQKLRGALPQWMPTIGVEGGYLNIVPVDFVANAICQIARQKNLDGQCFHIVDPAPQRVGDVLNIFARAAHAPQLSMRIDLKMLDMIPKPVRTIVGGLPQVKRLRQTVLEGFDLPSESLGYIRVPTKFACDNTTKALAGSGIACPPLKSYAAPVWDYWERHLDPDLFRAQTLSEVVDGKVVIITGASSGIGEAMALKLAHTKANIILVARTEEKLQETKQKIAALGGTAYSYAADVSDLAACDRLIAEVIRDHGRIDILINNAGRSIRRAIANSLDRFHDYERTMQLNYFGALRLIMNSLPAMLAQKRGHIINISSIGVLTNAPRFSAYIASKAALDAFSRSAATEFSDKGIRFTTINMPLVRTPMIAPTDIYKNFPALSPEEAADLIEEAIVKRPKRIATRLGIAVQLMHYVTPKLTEVIMNMGFNMFPDSKKAAGDGASQANISSEQLAFSYFMRGIHW